MSADPAIQPGTLLDWVDSPQPNRGVRTLHDGRWRLCPYPVLAAHVRGAAAQLASAGVAPGDVVAICDPDALGFIAAFFGTLYAGATPAPLPSRSTNPAELLEHITGVLREVRPAAFVTGTEAEAQLQSAD
jgi:acyl-CoA synthetase (AMP-forming)/AMP-acid ligase II